MSRLHQDCDLAPHCDSSECAEDIADAGPVYHTYLYLCYLCPLEWQCRPWLVNSFTTLLNMRWFLNSRWQIKSHCHTSYPANFVSVALHTLLFLAIDVNESFVLLETTLDDTSYTIHPTTADRSLGSVDKLRSDRNPLQYNNTPIHSRRQSTLHFLCFQNPAPLSSTQISRRAAVHHMRLACNFHAEHSNKWT